MICKNCHKELEEHFPDPNRKYITNPFWCVENARIIFDKIIRDPSLNSEWFTLLTDTTTYRAMDNLSYIEYLAEQKHLV